LLLHATATNSIVMLCLYFLFWKDTGASKNIKVQILKFYYRTNL